MAQVYDPLNAQDKTMAAGTDQEVLLPEELEGNGSVTVKKTDFKNEKLSNAVSGDAYDAVVVAAFGGVLVALPSDPDGTQQSVRLHPFFIFLFCLVLFVVQLSCLSCLIMDMSLDNFWNEQDGSSDTSWEGFDHSPVRQMKLMVKSLMIAVLQMIVLKELLGSMRPFCLLMNPVTWAELKRPSTSGTPSKPLGWSSWMFHSWICCPICLAAQLMQFGVAYYVLSVSMSVIIIATDVKEVIFNGLVVTFLMDLDEFAWFAMSAVFHLDQETYDNFHFEIVQELVADKEEAHKAARVDKERKAAQTDLLFGLTFTKGWKFWFYHGKGGKATILENNLIFSTLTFIYVRQLCMYVQAIHTGILPVARDICSLYRGMKHPQDEWLHTIAVKVIDFFTLINYEVMLEHHVESYEKNHNVTDYCLSHEMRAGPFHHIIDYGKWWPKQVLGGLFVIVLLFLAPQLIYSNYQTIWSGMKPGNKKPEA